MMICSVIGIDCATQPNRIGLALAHFDSERWRVIETLTCGPMRLPLEILATWVGQHPRVLLALDAPLGWPIGMVPALASHRAGEVLPAEASTMFNRETDRSIHERLKTRPFDVGADKIGRTAHSALSLLRKLRESTGYAIPLAWLPGVPIKPVAIEVYPAASLRAHGLMSVGYTRVGTESRRVVARALTDKLKLFLPSSFDAETVGAHELDAVLCVVAGIDFVEGMSVPPKNLGLARREGWIWARQQVEQPGEG